MHSEIDKLPPKCRQTFLLSKKEGLTNQEISEHLNISIKTVETHMTNAFSILRAKVAEKIDSIIMLSFSTYSK